MPGRVGILRHSLFLPSERFIPDQARSIPGWTPVLLARDALVDVPAGVTARQLPGMAGVGRAAYTVIAWDAPLQRAIRAERLDLLHAHFGVEGVYSRRAAVRAGIPHVVTLHGFDVSYSEEALRRSRKPAWLHYASRRKALLQSDSTFVCVSEHIRSLAIGLGLDPARGVVIPTGVDSDRLVPSPLPDAPRIVHVARLVEKKGTSVLLDALAELHAEGVRAELDIIGDGPLRGALEARAHQVGVGQSVTFRGAQPHAVVLDAIERARVLCQPSITASSGDTEGLGQAVLEAGALGRPVVATRHGGIQEVVDDERNGLLVPEADAHALAAALRRVLEDGQLASSLAAANREVVRSRFDQTRQAARLAAVYDAAVEGRVPRI